MSGNLPSSVEAYLNAPPRGYVAGSDRIGPWGQVANNTTARLTLLLRRANRHSRLRGLLVFAVPMAMLAIGAVAMVAAVPAPPGPALATDEDLDRPRRGVPPLPEERLAELRALLLPSPEAPTPSRTRRARR